MSKSQYRVELDGMRAFAILAVIINHIAKKILPGGFLGVDVFFVISGYVVTSSLSNSENISVFKNFINFYSKRVKRLLPALLLAIIIGAILISLFNPSPDSSLKTGFYSIFGGSGFYLLSEVTNYFSDEASLNVFTHTWSLGIEEQFYLLFPFLFFGLKDKSKFFLSMLILISLSSLLFIYWSLVKPEWAFYLLPSRFWEIGVGAITFLLMKKRKKPSSFFSIICAIICMICFFISEKWSFLSTPLIVLSTAILIYYINPISKIFRILAHPFLLHIGKTSYSLYLWHWIIIVIARWTIGVTALTILPILITTALMSEISYNFIERPLRYRNWGVPIKTIKYGAGVAFLVACILYGLYKPLKGSLFVGDKPNLLAHGVHTLIQNYEIKDRKKKIYVWKGDKCVLSDNDEVGKIIESSDCTLGNRIDAKKRILVVGNSFSAALIGMFDNLVKKGSWAVTVTSSWGASVVPEVINNGAWDKASKYYWKKIIPSLLKELKKGDYLFLVNDMSSYSKVDNDKNQQTRLSHLEEGLTNLYNNLKERNIKLYVLDGLPFVRDAKCDPSLAIKQWFAPNGGHCKFYTKEQTLHRREPLDTLLKNLEKENILKVVDLMDIFCSKKMCDYTTSSNTLLYRDIYSHPSIEGARLSSNKIEKIFN